MSEDLILVDKVFKKYNKQENFALNDISFSIQKGEKFGILGPNGAGKTTLISILCKILKPDSGKIIYNFEGPENCLKRNIGYIPQDFAFFEELSPLQNLEYFGAMYDIQKTDLIQTAAELLEMLGLSAFINKKVKTFSGGMKRRLNLAIGLIHKPQIVFLDEPTVGVDIQSRNAILNFLNNLNFKGMTIIYTSHHLLEAEEFCSKIAIIDYGKIIAMDKLETLKSQFQSKNLSDLLINLTGEEYRDYV